jgi:hypothetical protein
MKYATLILGLAIALASVLAARADTIPAAYRGTWCQSAKSSEKWQRCRYRDPPMTIKATAILTDETTCALAGKITPAGNGIMGKFRCAALDSRNDRWRSLVEMRLVDGTLFFFEAADDE